MSDERHVLVIDAGAAGARVARTLASAGWRVTVVEHGQFGGNCLRAHLHPRTRAPCGRDAR